MELLDEESLEEISTTAGVDGYSTPFAFSSKEDEKKKKKRLKKSTGYSFVSEALDDKDLKQINKLIRDVVGDILRDIWLKRNAWKQEISKCQKIITKDTKTIIDTKIIFTKMINLWQYLTNKSLLLNNCFAKNICASNSNKINKTIIKRLAFLNNSFSIVEPRNSI